MFGEIAEQSVHLREVGSVDQVSALLLNGDQPGVRKLLQVKGQCIAGNAKLIGHHAGCETAVARDHECSKHAQALGMSQGIEGGDSLIFIHDSIIQQLLNSRANRKGGWSLLDEA